MVPTALFTKQPVGAQQLLQAIKIEMLNTKDGELCLSRSKSEETLMEDRSDSDVQIDRQTWV